MTSTEPHISRSSTERNSREKSQSRSEERTLPPAEGSSARKVEVEDNSQLAQNIAQFDLDGFQIRPKFGEKFSPAAVQEMMETVMKEYFQSKRKYQPDLAEEYVAEVGQLLTTKLRSDFNYPRYKFVTYVVVGEKIGGGIHMGMKCLWDSDSDSYATYTFMTDHLFCVATICAVFYY